MVVLYCSEVEMADKNHTGRTGHRYGIPHSELLVVLAVRRATRCGCHYLTVSVFAAQRVQASLFRDVYCRR